MTIPDSLWHSAPLEAFVLFVSSPAFKESAYRVRYAETISPESVFVYQSMFSQFLKFCQERHVTLFSVQPEQIYGFLTQVDEASEVGGRPVLQSDIQHRYLRLLERMYSHLGVLPRPTDHLLFGPLREVYQLRGRNQATVVLSEEQIQRFFDALPVPSPLSLLRRPNASWKKRRDRALQCMILGAGLTISEVIVLNREEIDSSLQTDGSLRISLHCGDAGQSGGKHATFQGHVTYVRPQWAAEVLAWLRERDTLAVPGGLVFPGSQGLALNKASVYRQIRQTFERSGMDLPRMGGRTLRNTFAVQALMSGMKKEVLSAQMGFYEVRSVDLYDHLVKKGEADES